jgi:hypothetical protein
MNTQKQNLKKVIEFAKSYGFRIIQKTAKPVKLEYIDGTTYLQFNSKNDMNNTDLAIHNLAHYICAAPLRRNLGDFGLGSSPDSDISLEPLLTIRASQAEEDLTCFVADWISVQLGILSCSIYGRASNPELFIEKMIAYGILSPDRSEPLKLRHVPDSPEHQRREWFLSKTKDFKHYSKDVLQ